MARSPRSGPVSRFADPVQVIGQRDHEVHETLETLRGLRVFVVALNHAGGRQRLTQVRLVTPTTLPISAVLSGLSAALDITEGHPRGHAARTCLIAMHIGDALRLSPECRPISFTRPC